MSERELSMSEQDVTMSERELTTGERELTTGEHELTTSAPNREPRLDVLATGLTETRPVCDLLSAQLDAVIDETENAAIGFIDRVHAIDGAVDLLQSRMGELVSQTDRQADVLEQMARDNAAAIEDVRVSIADRDRKVRELVGELRELERYGRGIRAVAATSKVLGLNALIQAAHAGDAGASFQVVANRIQDLAGDSDVAARELEHGITDLTARIMATIGDESKGAGDSQSSQFEHRLGAIADGQATLSAHVGELRRSVEDANGATQTLAELATGIAADVQFQDITRQATQQVQQALKRLGDRSELLIAYADGRAEAEEIESTLNALEQMSGDYVIQRQRAIHAAVASGHDGDLSKDGPAIELF